MSEGKPASSHSNTTTTHKTLSLYILMAIFPGEPRLDGFLEANNDGNGGANCSCKSCKAPVKSSPPTNQHPTFYRSDALPVANQQCQTTEGKLH